jgi:hypothetical protein
LRGDPEDQDSEKSRKKMDMELSTIHLNRSKSSNKNIGYTFEKSDLDESLRNQSKKVKFERESHLTKVLSSEYY